MANRLTVHNQQQPIYDICLDSGFKGLREALAGFDADGHKACIVADSQVGRIYAEEVREVLKPCFSQLDVWTFPAGEGNKTLDTVRSLYAHLIQGRFDRKDFLVALGGGVTGDLCGFAAATYLRGVRFIQLPTSLLSQVDSSIGGKTGVDFDSYKNMVGAFHMPSLVYANTQALLSLADEQFSSGMGEVVKHGLIQDAGYYRWLSGHREAIWRRDLDVCEEMVLRSVQIKRKVVEEDPMEQGVRALLNYGHTLGHAIEKLMGFSMLHGHCVGVGALAAAHISVTRGYLTEQEAEGLRDLLEAFHLPVKVQGLATRDVLAATRLDKKMDSGKIRFILLRSIGDAFVDDTVTDEEMEQGLSYVLA